VFIKYRQVPLLNKKILPEGFAQQPCSISEKNRQVKPIKTVITVVKLNYWKFFHESILKLAYYTRLNLPE
jgi:hypothetical protein